MSSKGQVIIPKAVRDAHGWKPGTSFVIENHADGLLLRPVPQVTPTTLDDVVGCLNWAGPPKSLSDMEAAVLREAKRRAGR
ncbi:MAG: AbrB/MazE/SpoVT family DNA-binding domain-containing protein [Hyphomicrobiaceae bacterium]|nr:AbrB/MazE/SpoVT family DNA-binding domain-containing protein [Hyphomicrobiaceae bacterium]